MSGPMSAISDQLARLSLRREDARMRARLARLSEGLVYLGLRHRPEPRDYGDFSRAAAALKGTLRLPGTAISMGVDLTPWDLTLPSRELEQHLHGFFWLDDMAGLGGKRARARAQGWTLGWLDRFGDGAGPGWTPSTAGDRLVRLITHLEFLEKDMPPESLARLQQDLPLHAVHLDAHWQDEAAPDRRLPALHGLLLAHLCLRGFEDRAAGTLGRIAGTVSQTVTETGGIAARSPEALLTVFRRLLAIQALTDEAGMPRDPVIANAIEKIAPALRALRHGDGSLARFHGGGASAEGLLDLALAESRVRRRPQPGPVMGYARLHGGRVTVIADCARPPDGPHGHASTLAFEMSAGRWPVIVSRGPAMAHLPDWQSAPRTTAAHSTLTLDKQSSATLPDAAQGGKPQGTLTGRTKMVTLAADSDDTGTWIQARHDGYLPGYGLVHERRIFCGAHGRQVLGQDVLMAPDANAEKIFARRIRGATRLGVLVQVHFHLHPDIELTHDREDHSWQLTLPNGEVWLFRQQGGEIEIAASSYIDPVLTAPRPTRQIVLACRITKPRAELGWWLTRQDAGDAAAPGH